MSHFKLRTQISDQVWAAEARCSRQMDPIASLRAWDRDTTTDEILLGEFEQSLTIMREYERQVAAMGDQA